MTLEQMYAGKPYSPPTELALDINAGDTTIEVLDGSVFPPAPSLAVIGTDENAETILYSALSGNILSGVTRGVQGAAKVWHTGDTIARNWTDKDYETLMANISALNNSKIETAGAGLSKNDTTIYLPDMIAPGTYIAVEVDAKGRVTGARALLASDLPELDWGMIDPASLPNTLEGYGINNAVKKTGDTMTGSLNLDYNNGYSPRIQFSKNGLVQEILTQTGNDIVISTHTDNNNNTRLLYLKNSMDKPDVKDAIFMNDIVNGGAHIYNIWGRHNLPVEIGTWTPVLAGATTAGVFTYTTQNGGYYKIGNLVNITMDIAISSVTTAPAGSMRINGLPFALRNNNKYSVRTEFPDYSGIVINAPWILTSFFGYISANSSYMNLYRILINNSTSAFQSSTIPATDLANSNIQVKAQFNYICN